MATSILQNDHVWIGGVGTFCFISQLLILVTHTQAENSVLTDVLVYIFLKGFMTHMMFVLAGVPALFRLNKRLLILKTSGGGKTI